MQQKLVLPIVAALIAAVVISGCVGQTAATTTEQACTASGGTVGTALCCQSASDFPNSCLIGACGCAPNYSHDVKTCTCGEGKCFDGNACVASR